MGLVFFLVVFAVCFFSPPKACFKSSRFPGRRTACALLYPSLSPCGEGAPHPCPPMGRVLPVPIPVPLPEACLQPALPGPRCLGFSSTVVFKKYVYVIYPTKVTTGISMSLEGRRTKQKTKSRNVSQKKKIKSNYRCHPPTGQNPPADARGSDGDIASPAPERSETQVSS